VCVLVALTQLVALGAQTCGTHAPALQVLLVAHGVDVQLRPSVAQVSRPVSVPPAQRTAPGVQMRVWQEPAAQLSVPAQATDE
jgi:hypothetical protein